MTRSKCDDLFGLAPHDQREEQIEQVDVSDDVGLHAVQENFLEFLRFIDTCYDVSLDVFARNGQSQFF